MSTRYLDLARQALRDRPRLDTPAITTEPRVLVLPPDRHRAARRDRTLRELAAAWCRECGFSCWAVTERGDASCYGCRLLARGITPRCARCKRREWRLEDGHRVCRYCEAARLAGRDSRVAPPPAVAAPESTSREVSEPGGAA